MTNVQWQQTLSDDATTADTLAAIIDIVNVYKLSPYSIEAASIVQQEAEAKGLSFCEMLFYWAAQNIDYKLDEAGIEVVKTPELTTLQSVADCKKFSILQGSILAAAGYEPIFKHVEYADDTQWTHIYIIVPLQGFNPDVRSSYIVLDPTNNKQYNSEVKYKNASLYYLNGESMKLMAMGNSQVGRNTANYGHDMIGGMAWGSGNVLDHMNWNGMGASNNPNGQAWVAFLSLVQMNANGLATALLQDLANNPSALDKVAAKFGGNVNELKTSVLDGSKVPSTNITVNAAPISGLNTRWSGVGAGPAWPPPLQSQQFYANNAGAMSTDNSKGVSSNQYINAVYSSIMAGQDQNGWYGWYATGGSNNMSNFWSGSDADADLRQAYANLGIWWGGPSKTPNNIRLGSVNGPTIPAPLAKGAAINGNAHGAPTILSVATPVLSAAANEVIPGSGTIVAQLLTAANATAQGGGAAIPPTFPASTMPPPAKTSIAGSIGGFFFKGMLATVAMPHSIALVTSIVVPCVTLALLTRKYFNHVYRKNHRNA